jgi:hypothetical protein
LRACFAQPKATPDNHGSVTRALVFINAAQNKAITYGRNDVLLFDRLNAA